MMNEGVRVVRWYGVVVGVFADMLRVNNEVKKPP
jgi:hypothetical protein